MWPRLISQLVEFLPHAARLMPVADNFLAVRREGAQAQAGAIADLAENLRVDVGRVADSYNLLARQITEQKAQITALHDALEVAETQSLTQTRQLEWITTDMNNLRIWVKFGVVTIVLLLVAVLALTIQIMHAR